MFNDSVNHRLLDRKAGASVVEVRVNKKKAHGLRSTPTRVGVEGCLPYIGLL